MRFAARSATTFVTISGATFSRALSGSSFAAGLSSSSFATDLSPASSPARAVSSDFFIFASAAAAPFASTGSRSRREKLQPHDFIGERHQHRHFRDPGLLALEHAQLVSEPGAEECRVDPPLDVELFKIHGGEPGLPCLEKCLHPLRAHLRSGQSVEAFQFIPVGP